MAGQRINVSVTADTRQFSRAMKNLGDTSGLNKLKGGLKAVGKAAALGAGAATVAVLAFGKKAVESASELQQATGAVDAVFKGNAKTVKAWGKNAADTVGLSAAEYQNFSALLGSQFKNAGVPMDKLAGKTDEMITLGADLSSMFGGTTTEAVDALSAAFKGEYDSLEKYGITLNQNAVNAELAARGQDKLTGAAKTQAEQQVKTDLIMKQSKDAQGNFAKESNTLAGQQQRLAAKWENLSAKIGQKFLPIVTKVVAYLSENLEPTFERISAWVRDEGVPRFQAFADKFNNDVLPVLKDLWAFVQNRVLPVLSSLGGFLGQNAGTLTKVTGAILLTVGAYRVAQRVAMVYKATAAAVVATQKLFSGAALGTRIQLAALRVQTIATAVATKAAAVAAKAGAVAQRILNAAMKANPLGIIITLIAGVVAALVWFFTKTKLGKKIIAVAWAGIKKAIKAVSDWWTKTAWPAIKKVIEALYKGFQTAKTKVAEAWKKMREALKAGWAWVSKYVFTPFRSGLTVLKDKFSTIRTAIKNIWTNLREGLRNGWKWISEHVFGKFKTGLSNLKKAFSNVKTGIKTVWDKIKGITAKPINFVLNTVYNNGIRKWWNAIADKVGLGSFKLSEAKLVKYANGTEDHRAQIARGGAMRLWAEPETGGEAYIPLAQAKRSRSTAILSQVAKKFGYTLSEYKDGGFWDKVGGVVSGIGRGVKGFGSKLWDYGKIAMEVISDPIGAIKRAASQIFSDKGNGGYSGDLIKIASALPVKLAGGLADKVKSLFDSGKGKGGAGGTGGAGLSGNLASMAAAARALDPSVRVTSGFRPGATTVTGFTSYHSRGRAIDMVSNNMGALWDKLYAKYGQTAPELYFSGRSFSRFGKKGAPRMDHWDHVHWAMANGGILARKKLLFDSGGMLPRGTSVVQNNTGRPEPLRRVDKEYGGNTYHINVNVPVGGNKVETGREIVKAIDAYEKANGRKRR